jgi:hypothetical protein
VVLHGQPAVVFRLPHLAHSGESDS